jgi:hypothetical protein
MHRWWSAVAASGFSLLTPSCGSRTGLALDATERPASESPNDGNGSSEQPGPGSVICSSLEGAVSSCIETAQSGPIQLCDSNFPHCVRPPGFDTWGCCAGSAPYNGASNCRFSSNLPSCPVYQAEATVDGGPMRIDECLPVSLPTTANEPVCSVFVARFPATAGTAPTPSTIADCRRCAEPGLSVPIDNEPAMLMDEHYGCLCEIVPLRDCAETSGSTASWCYADADAGTIATCPEASLDINVPSGLAADLYIACFE